MVNVVLELPAALRGDLKEPFGPVLTDAQDLLDAAGEPLITVGDVVTSHVIEAGATPDVALVDERTERAAVDASIARTISQHDGFDREVTVENPPATLSAALLEALRGALAAAEYATLIAVDGEEDLAAVPAIIAAPSGATVVYGQPGEGMVHVTVDETVRDRAMGIFEGMDGDVGAAATLLGVDADRT